jgi:hypothetical protein
MQVQFQPTAVSSTSGTQTNLSIEQVKSILCKILVPVVRASAKEAIELKESYKATLNQAFAVVSKQIAAAKDPEEKKQLYGLLGEIMTKFGRLKYEENYPSCMVFMRASLNAQLFAIGVYSVLCFEVDKFENLEQLEKALFQHDQFRALDDFIISSDTEAMARAIQDKGISSEDLMTLGYTLSWMANSLHHTQGFGTSVADKSIESRNHHRFDQIYSLCEKILLAANSEPAILELAEMYYNGLRGVELRKDPKNIIGAHQWLDKAMVLNQTKEMHARVANLESCDWAGAGDLEKAKLFLDEAIMVRKSFPKDQQDPFLVANLHSRKAGFLLKEGKMDEADHVIDCAIEYSTACRGNRNPQTDELLDKTHDHQYFGIYDMKKAQIKAAKKDFKEAMKFINRALETFMHHVQDSQDLILMAKVLKAQLILLI